MTTIANYKDITPLKKQIKTLKQSVYSSNSDYMTGYLSAISGIQGVIDRLPSVDAVPMVRCKDCKLYEEVEYYHPTEKATKRVCRLFKRQMQPDDYCSYGKRKCDNG